LVVLILIPLRYRPDIYCLPSLSAFSSLLVNQPSENSNG
jgi:hypothetical protein